MQVKDRAIAMRAHSAATRRAAASPRGRRAHLPGIAEPASPWLAHRPRWL